MPTRPPGKGRQLGQAPVLHPLAWVVWLLATMVALLSTRNPVYLAITLACVAGALQAGRALAFAPPLPLSVWRFGLIVVTLSAAFNGLMSHFGQTVLFILPEWLPLIGGPVTLEGVTYGVLSGLVLTGMFAAFLALYQAVPTYALIRLIPRAFYSVGVVISVAIAYVPATLAQFQQIREAQQVRGHKVRGVQDWLPLAMPLLVSGLERAMQLAEAMTARGFGGRREAAGSVQDTRWRGVARVLLIAGLWFFLGGIAARLLAERALALALIAAGGLAVVVALWMQGRGVQRTAYRPQPWTRVDWLLAGSSALVIAVYLLPMPGVDRSSLAWSPYPRLSIPDINGLIALSTLGLLVPTLLLARATNKNRSPRT